MSPSPLGQKTILGVAWVTAARVYNQAIGFIVGLILMNLLGPEHFGLVGMVMVVTGFVWIFAELGFGSALIQREDLDERHTSSVFWLNLPTGLLFGAFVAAFAPLLAAFYGEPELLWITRVTALTFLIAPLGMVQRTLLVRDMQFRQLATAEAVAGTLSGVAAVAMAAAGLGVWALVLRGLISSALSSAILFWVSPWRPTWSFDWSAVRDLIGFGAGIMGFRFVNYWARQVDDLLIGRVMGAASLGEYSRAYQLMMLPITEVAGVLTRVMFPALSRIQDDKPRVKSIYLRALSYIALISFPLMVGLFAVADRGVPLLFGEKWSDIVPILQILCPVGMIQSLATTTGWIYQSQGRADLMFRWGLFASPVLVVGIVWGVLQGTPVHVALGYAIAMLILSVPVFWVPGRLIGLRPLEVFAAVSGVAACAAAMGGAVWGLGVALGAHLSDLAIVLLQIASGIAIYWALIRVFRVAAYAGLWELVCEQCASARRAGDE